MSRRRRVYFGLVVVLLVGALSGVGATSAAAQAPGCPVNSPGTDAPLEMPDPAPTFDASLDGVYGAIGDLVAGVLNIRVAIESQEDFPAGWTETGDVAAAVEAVRTALGDLETEFFDIAGAWGLRFEPGPGLEGGPWPDPPFPDVLADLSLLTTGGPLFDKIIPHLDDQRTRDDALAAWTVGGPDGGTCNWAQTYVHIAELLEGGSVQPPGGDRLADTGVDSTPLILIAASLIGAGAAILATNRRHWAT